jgi:hypothetical protein
MKFKELLIITLVTTFGIMHLTSCQTKNIRYSELQTTKLKKEKVKNTTANKSNEIVINRYENLEPSQLTYKTNTDRAQNIEADTEKVVRPELIEKYRRARNIQVYVDLYPIDWESINRDRGIKNKRERKSRKNNQFIGNPWICSGPFCGFWPNMGIGWSQNAGYYPYINLGWGTPFLWGPNGWIGWNSISGWNSVTNFGSLINPYNTIQPFPFTYFYPYPYFGLGVNRYRRGFNDGYFLGKMQALESIKKHSSNIQDTLVQQNNSMQNPTDKEVNNHTNKQINPYDYSDGVGGPERYERNVKKIEDYKIK